MLMTRMLSETPGHARAQAADAADDQIDPHAGLRSPVEQRDDLGIDQRIQLGDDPRGVAGLGVRASRARSALHSRLDRWPGATISLFQSLLCE